MCVVLSKVCFRIIFFSACWLWFIYFRNLTWIGPLDFQLFTIIFKYHVVLLGKFWNLFSFDGKSKFLLVLAYKISKYLNRRKWKPCMYGPNPPPPFPPSSAWMYVYILTYIYMYILALYLDLLLKTFPMICFPNIYSFILIQRLLAWPVTYWLTFLPSKF